MEGQQTAPMHMAQPQQGIGPSAAAGQSVRLCLVLAALLLVLTSCNHGSRAASTYVVNGETISFGNGREVTFLYPVAETLEIDGVVVVRLDVPLDVVLNENVYGLDQDGVELWQIPARDFVLERSPYVWLREADGLAYLGNLSDDVLTVGPRTGDVLEHSFIQ